MPKSNSDADENDSLTSDGEEAGPPPVQPRDGLSPKSQTFTHRTGRTNRRRPTMPAESFQIDRSAPPIEQFRMAARKARLPVMKIRKAHIALKDLSPGMGGEMQGSTMYEMYGHRRENCKVHVWDYGPTRAVPRSFDTNYAFTQWLEGEGSKPRGVWNKVRWINISGLSWDILSELQLKYDLHPLSLDVVMNGRDNARSKADYFVKHLFIHILSHTLPPEESPPTTKSLTPLSQEPEQMESPRQSKTYDPEAGKEALPYSSVRRRPTRGATLATLDDELYNEGADLTRVLARGPDGQDDATKQAERKRRLNEQAIDTLKQGTGQIKVDVKSVFMFLLRDGTLITIQRNPTREFGKPIYDRLRLRDTLLRSSGDASLLLQSLIDMIVDEAVKITDKYHRRLLKMERDILTKTKMRTVRDLHIASGDLTLHKRTLAPIAQLVYGLRRYDLDRCKALMPPGDEVPTTGFLSHQAKVYLADVHDHIEYIISSLDMFSSIAENLINYTFNLVSYETNQVMRGLTVATVIFFPLTFLTGYFGMNFEDMPSVQKNSDALFWYIAVPVMVVVVTVFLWPDIRRFMHFLKKRAATSQFDVKKLKSKTV